MNKILITGFFSIITIVIIVVFSLSFFSSFSITSHRITEVADNSWFTPELEKKIIEPCEKTKDSEFKEDCFREANSLINAILKERRNEITFVLNKVLNHLADYLEINKEAIEVDYIRKAPGMAARICYISKMNNVNLANYEEYFAGETTLLDNNSIILRSSKDSSSRADFLLDIPYVANLIDYEFVFKGGGDGLLTIFFEGVEIGRNDEKNATSNEFQEFFLLPPDFFPLASTPGKHPITFRLDAFGESPSEVVISNFRIGYILKEDKRRCSSWNSPVYTLWLKHKDKRYIFDFSEDGFFKRL